MVPAFYISQGPRNACEKRPTRLLSSVRRVEFALPIAYPAGLFFFPGRLAPLGRALTSGVPNNCSPWAREAVINSTAASSTPDRTRPSASLEQGLAGFPSRPRCSWARFRIETNGTVRPCSKRAVGGPWLFPLLRFGRPEPPPARTIFGPSRVRKERQIRPPPSRTRSPIQVAAGVPLYCATPADPA